MPPHPEGPPDALDNCLAAWAWLSSDSCWGCVACQDDQKIEAGLWLWPSREQWCVVSSFQREINNRLQTWDHLETKVFFHRVLVTLKVSFPCYEGTCLWGSRASPVFVFSQPLVTRTA